ncbi:YjcQ family protein [Edaphobacillus lindanitolerans]|uniref:YjcQ protein n=1 Tax=Edaphobacillus lindanitolerans TaxID=550447 RepID=A0A1U7PSR5_9BACI|nr:YjcQ family protein [Edaphobacillus lindanitolerans]SIT91619.1 YjcQ protein [Edaphobacillus lindanitolerans]
MDTKKLRYAILREVDSGNSALTEKDFDVAEDDFDEAIRHLDREGYLVGIFYADDRPQLFEGTARVTERGEEYLEENKSWKKLYKGLKEIRDWLK